MAGRPVLRAMLATLTRLAVETDVALYDDGGTLRIEDSAEAYAFAWLAGGAPQGHRPTVLGLAEYLGVRRPILYAWLSATTERKDRLRIAREECAGALVDQSLQLLDEATPFDASLATARANFRKWLASVYDRQTFGTSQAPALSISVGHLHLQAHEALKVGRPGELSTLPIRPTPERLAESHSDVSIVDDPILIDDNDLAPEDVL